MVLFSCYNEIGDQMKRLIQISLDTLLFSLMPILMWIVLGYTVQKEIANVFSLTYPLQFFFGIFTSIFAVGPNITSLKKEKTNIIYSNMIFGVIFVGILTLLLVINIDSYISFLNMDPKVYRLFGIYSIILLYLVFIVNIIIEKLYYKKENNTANKISFIFNISNFVLIVLLTYFLPVYLGIILTLIIDSLIIIVLLFKFFKREKFELMFKENVGYTSFGIISNIFMFLTHAIGISNSFSFGKKYITAMSIHSLTVDTQWDMLGSVSTVSKIDLANKEFNYKKSKKDAYQLLGCLITSTIIMNIVLYLYFRPNLTITIILLIISIIDMLAHPIIYIKLSYLQINDNKKRHNASYTVAETIRLLCSFIPNPFCLYIGQLSAMIYFWFYTRITCRKVKLFHYKKHQ